jgi:hypothetical protein
MKNNDYLELSGLDLAMMEFPKEQFCIQDILPKGLVILSSEMAAPARSLAMDMCLRVVKGDMLWKMDTRQGAALYMIHQHTLATIRNLITDMTVRIPDDLYVGVMEESSLELALIGIKTFVQDHSNAAMVVIELNAPVEQYEDAVYVPGALERYFRALKDEALKHGMAVVVTLCSEYYPASYSKTQNEDMVCITNKADGHIDMCILDAEDHEAILRVVTPPMAPRLWSVEFDTKRRRWEEENAGDHQ